MRPAIIDGCYVEVGRLVLGRLRVLQGHWVRESVAFFIRVLVFIQKELCPHLTLLVCFELVL